MAFAGGVFSKLYSWVTEQASSPIEISKLDAQETDFATGLSSCLLRDGTGLPTASIPFNGQKITDLGNATADADALNRITGDGRYITASAVNTLTASATSTAAPIKISSAAPGVYLNETDSAANSRLWRQYINAGVLADDVCNDDGTSPLQYRLTTRTGVASVAIAYTVSALTVNGSNVDTGDLSFTGTFTGFSGSPTATFKYRISAGICTLWCDSGFTATSATSAMTVTGVPAAARPATVAKYVTCTDLFDNSTGPFAGNVQVTTGGVLVIGIARTNTVANFVVNNNTGFTASGSKGLQAGWSISYPLS